jgi:hypothetical protein
MARFAGLDIGTHSVTGAVFSGKAGNFRLDDFFVEEVPSILRGAPADATDELGTPIGIDEFLERIIREHKLKDAEVVIGVDSKECVQRDLTVPFIKDEQIARTIFFEAESHFPGIDFEGATLDYLKVEELGTDRSRLIAWVLDNNRIEARLRVVQEMDVDPVALDLDVTALFNAFTMTPVYDPEQSVLLIDMGRSSTRLVLIEKGRIKKTRSIRVDTRSLDAAKRLPAAMAAAADGAAPAVAVEVVGDGDLSSLFSDSTIESRFREIEEALQRIDPSLDSELAKALGEDESEATARVSDSTIAILSDDEYDLVREEELTSEDVELFQGQHGASAQKPEEPQTRRVPRASATAAAPSPEGASSAVEDAEETEIPRAVPSAQAQTFDFADYMTRLVSEIQRFVVGQRLEKPIELVSLTGGMATEEARRYLAEELDVETVFFDFGDAFPTALDAKTHRDVGRVGAVAVGLAARLLGRDAVGIDFRKGRFRYEHKLVKLRFPLLVAAALFFFMSLHALFWSIRDWKEEKQRFEAVKSHAEQSFVAFFGRPVTNGLSPLQDANLQQQKWMGRGMQRDSRYLDFVEAVKNLSEIFGSEKALVRISSLDLNLRAKLRRTAGGPAAPQPASPAGAGARTGVTVPTLEKSTVIVETTDPQLLNRLNEAFRGPASTVFLAKVQGSAAPRGEDNSMRLTIELNVKSDKLKELQ